MRWDDGYDQKQLGPDERAIWSKINSLFVEDETKDYLDVRLKKGAAEKLISKSAYWYVHSSGSPVRAPGHHERIYGGSEAWKIDFGANTFIFGRQRSFAHAKLRVI